MATLQNKKNQPKVFKKFTPIEERRLAGFYLIITTYKTTK
jgi:hypothetical protein